MFSQIAPNEGQRGAAAAREASSDPLICMLTSRRAFTDVGSNDEAILQQVPPPGVNVCGTLSSVASNKAATLISAKARRSALASLLRRGGKRVQTNLHKH